MPGGVRRLGDGLLMFANLPVDWLRFAVATALLLFPLPLLFGRGVHYREVERSWQRYIGRALTLPWHWIDLLRVLGGTHLLMSAIGLSRAAGRFPDKWAIVLLALVLGAGVVVQCVACKCPEGFHAAVVFVTGVIAVLLPPLVAGLTLVSALTIGLAIRSIPAFFFGLPVGLVVLGYFFYPQWFLIGIGVVVSLVPGLLPVMFQRELMLALRASPAQDESDLK